MSATGHQPDEELRSFLLGLLSEERLDQVGQLIDATPELQQTLLTLNDPPDALLETLRQAVPAGECARETDWPQLVERLHAVADSLPRRDAGKDRSRPPQ